MCPMWVWNCHFLRVNLIQKHCRFHKKNKTLVPTSIVPMFSSQALIFFIIHLNRHCTRPLCHHVTASPRSCRDRRPLSSQPQTSSPLMGECKCVIYTCLVFYHDKAVHTLGKGGKRNAGSSFIHRLSCFIHTLVILYHAPLSSRQEAGRHWNKSLIFCFLVSFFLPVASPISLFILHMWLPAC